MTIRIVQIKVYPERGSLDNPAAAPVVNHGRLMDLLGQIAPHKVDVVITPECFLDGYVADSAITAEDLGQCAIDPATAPEVTAAREWAAANRAWMIYGCMRRTNAGIYNTALVINREGVLVGQYDKTHLQTHDLKFLPGEALPVFDSDFGKFGVMICADRRWPETVRTLALRGARVIFNPTYGMHDDRNRHTMQTRSYESEVIIAFTHPAQALITGPRGEILHDEESPDVAFTVTEIDLVSVDDVRGGPSAHLRDRRPDLYQR